MHITQLNLNTYIHTVSHAHMCSEYSDSKIVLEWKWLFSLTKRTPLGVTCSQSTTLTVYIVTSVYIPDVNFVALDGLETILLFTTVISY